MVPYPIIWIFNMSYDCYCHTVAFGELEDVCQFALAARDLMEELDVGGRLVRTQWAACHYAVVSHQGSYGRDVQFWDRIIPQFPNLRFLLSRTCEQESFLTEIVRHRHEPYGFNSCLLDRTTPQALGEFASVKNPIAVLNDFYDEISQDQWLRHALNLLGYPVGMLVGCEVSAFA